MKHLIRLTDFTKEEVFEIFKIADEISRGEYENTLKGKTAVMFFPESSIRTRVSFEKGIFLLGGQTLLFPPSTLDKKEKLEDVVGYLNNWADVLVVRHKNIQVLEEIAKYSKCPVINAMTDLNHPCEVLSDLYALSRRRVNYLNDKFLFVGESENIGLAWKELAQVMGLDFTQCCNEKYKMAGVNWCDDLEQAILGKDIICTDSIPAESSEDFRDYQITLDLLHKANPNALLNPCPPFYREAEVSSEAIESPYFVGYGFKKGLLVIQQAIVLYCLLGRPE